MAYRVGQRAAASRLRTDFPSIAPAPGSSSPFSAAEIEPGPCPEIDCLRGRIAADVLAEAEARAAAIGVGADRVLIAAGVISEEDCLRSLADALGIVFDSLDGIPRERCPIDNDRLIDSVAAGMVPLRTGGDLCLVVAPRGTAARRIARLIEDNPELKRRFRLTTIERLNAFVFRHCAGNIAERAANGLKMAWPALSAAPPRWRPNVLLLAVVAIAALAILVAAPAQTTLASEILLATIFLAWLALRLAGAVIAWTTSDPPLALRVDEFPVYTIISALYREAASVESLLTAIERLDYPGIMAQTPQAIC